MKSKISQSSNTILSKLEKWVTDKPEKKAYTFLTNGSPEVSLTYAELDNRAKAIAGEIGKTCKKGDRALLLFPSCLDFIPAFFGCLYAGVIAVPAYPPKKSRKMERLNLIIEDCEASIILSTGKTFENSLNAFKKNEIDEKFNWIKVDNLDANSCSHFEGVEISPQDVSFLQYTSGSTGNPKGVVVTHKNLYANSELIYEAMSHSEESVVVSWLPLFHDMGLIGGMIQSLFAGGSTIIMAPETFLLKPVRWFEAISKYKATATGAPNFAYDLCVKSIKDEDLEGMDLSSLKIVFSGAEPVLAETLDNFSNRFSHVGFDKNMYYPCYGMAETTLMVTGPGALTGYRELNCDKDKIKEHKVEVLAKNETGKRIVGCGFSWSNHQVCIVEPNTLEKCNNGTIGEIWVKGPSVANGYWNKQDINKEVFEAFISSTNEGPYLRTGDMGVIMENELYITGRLKDVVIIRGKNHYPQDIEATVVNSHEALLENSSAVFSIEANGEEKLIVVQELKRSYTRTFDGDEIAQSVSSNVFMEHGVLAHSIVLLKPYSIPKTSSGKIQRNKCKEKFLDNELDDLYTWANGNKIEANVPEEKCHTIDINRDYIDKWLQEKLSTLSSVNINNIDRNKPFSSYGLDSVSGLSLVGECQDLLKIEFPVSIIYDYPTIEEMSGFLWDEYRGISHVSDISEPVKDNSKEDIAIIGMECSFPGARNCEEYWQLLRDGRDAITEVPDNRWDWKDHYTSEVEKGKMNTRWGGFLQNVDEFDASFFNITPVEAMDMDPQQRILLEQTYKTLENSGYTKEILDGSDTGVFVGISNSDYGAALKQNDLTAYIGTGNSMSIAANRLSYTFNWKGPSIALDSACSSSLTAIHLACQSLKSGDCSMAIAGAVNLILTPELTIALSQAQMMSSDGKCKTFDSRADGYVRSEGCGIVALKRLSDAEKDDDHILAVIEGSALVQDGRSNGLTSPNGRAQQEVIVKALNNSGRKPEEISFVETHGTGTSLGDPVEIQALNKTYGSSRKKPLIVGSVKANIGHLEVCAGMAGLIKAVLCLEHKVIPPQLHIDELNPHINWKETSLEIPHRQISLMESESGNIAAGVSSFGFGGTNSHVIVSEGKRRSAVAKKEVEYTLLPISAESEESLRSRKESFVEYLSSDSCSYSVSATASIHRDHFNYRDFYVSDNIDNLKHEIKTSLNSGNNEYIHSDNSRVAFMFSGQGSQYKGMGRNLYGKYSVFTDVLDECALILKEDHNISLFDLIWGEEAENLNSTEYTQPALFALEVALAGMWLSFGVKPDVLIGHSLGEFSAAYIAGVFSLKDAFKLVCARGRLMSGVSNNGGMLSVLESIETVRSYIEKLDGILEIAVLNGNKSVVIAGKVDLIDQISLLFERDGIKNKKLDVSGAFHSSLMKPVIKDFRNVANEIVYSSPSMDIISNVSGMVHKVFDADYWVKHIEATVLFTSGMDILKEMNINSFVEVGPSSTLLGLAAGYLNNDSSYIPSLSRKIPSQKRLLLSLGTLYKNGASIKWDMVYSESYEKVKLPSYPFNKKRYWKIDSVNKKVEDKIVKDKKVYLKVDNIEERLKEIIKVISGIDTSDIKNTTDLMSLGLDSLMLVQFRKKIVETFSLEITIEKFLMDLTTIEKIGEYIRENTTSTESEDLQIAEEIPSISSDKVEDGVYSLLHKKLDIMKDITQSLNHLDSQLVNINKSSKIQEVVVKEKTAEIKHEKINFRTYQFENEDFTKEQKVFITELINRYSSKTKGSKEYNSRLRKDCSHWLSSLNFRMSLKEILYPIIAKKGDGAYFWDIDGNEYLDFAMGYGSHFFGHKPDFITSAIKAQIDDGYVLTPHMGNLEEASRLFKKITGTERITYCNTGSEAVMFAIRLARTYTGKKKIVKFAGSYHGVYDGVLAENINDNLTPLCAGITDGSFEDTEVLLYGSSDSLERIREIKDEIAAVIVEPVQSRRPGLQPGSFLKELRAITSDSESVLIFDEMITGFRIHPGGAQAYFGVEADLVTYGKIVGGGMPIGIVAGKNKLMDCVDGGDWNYGDKSTPEAETTFIAGTFANHPVAVASMTAALKEIDRRGMVLYEKINAIAYELGNTLNKYFEQNSVPIKIRQFGSLFRFESYGQYDLAFNPIEMDLFFYLLKEYGIYVWERKICFLSTKHTLADIEKLKNAVISAVTQIRKGGFPFSTGEPSDPGSGKSINTEDIIPMTSAQKRMYTLSLLDGGDLPYHITDVKRVKGSLDLNLLKSSLDKIVLRHESLRTSFFVEDGDFFQKIHDKYKLDITEVTINENDIRSTVSGFIKPFDLSKPTQMRVLIGKIDQNDYLLVLDFHHIVVDGYSASVLAMELMSLYKGNNIQVVSKQLRDYLTWEQKFINSEAYGKQKDFWKKKFEDKPDPLNLPLDHSRSAEKNFEGKTLSSVISKETCMKIKNKCSSLGITSYNFLLTSLYILLAKLTGQNDISLGTPVAIRDQGDFEETVGMLTNTVVLRSIIDTDKDFSQLSRDIKLDFMTSFINKEYLYEELVQSIGGSITKSRNPLFDVMFTYENGNERVFNVDNLEFHSVDYTPDLSMFDLGFEVIEESGYINLNIDYDTALFNEETIIRWREYYTRIIDYVLDSSDVSINKVDIITSDERRLLVTTLNKTECKYSDSKSIIELFEEQVEKTPDNTALVFNDIELTYRELNQKANIVGNYLRDNYNVKADDLFGVMIPRSENMIIALLGILKSGGGYVPIDPEYPEERVEYILKDSSPKGIIGEKRDDGIYIGIEEILDSGSNKNNPVVITKPENLAYVIYTSGSTGEPKGVLLENSGVINLIESQIKTYGITEDERILLFTNICFDASVEQIGIALLSGSALVVIPKESLLSVENFNRYISDKKITHMDTVPTFLNDIDLKLNRDIRRIILGGESCSVNIVRKFIDKTDLYNCYGPTETSITSLVYRIDHLENKQTNIPIGKAVDNTKLYILDRNQNLLPYGVPGELCISGAGIARGYLNKSELTDKSFIEHPFLSGEKIYRTGDLVRLLPDGNVEFLGRIDHQVKIRGYRIELGEIENTLSAYNSIDSAVVVVKEGSNGEKSLVGYYEAEKELNVSEIRRFIGITLPDYMIPSLFVHMDKMPLTLNGKINRKALPEPDEAVNTGEEYVAPGNDIEERLAGLWQEILNIKRVGIRDDFFDLGGHSLKATSTISRIAKEFEVKLDLKDVFDNPTIEALSKVISSSSKREYKHIEVVEKQDSYELSSGQRRLWILDQLEENSLAYNMPASMILEGKFNETAFRKAFSYMIERHESLRTVFVTINGEPRQKIVDDQAPGFKIIDLRSNIDNEEDAKKIVEKEITTSFDLESGPLIRFTIIRLTENKYIMVFNMHHIISDGWSINIFINEFLQLYNHYINGEEPSLEPLRIQYKDYSAWQKNFLESSELKEQREYWHEKLSGEIPVLEMPSDKARPSIQSFTGNSIDFSISSNISKKLNTLCRDNHVSLFIMLQALIKILLHKYTDQSDFIIGSPIAGRTHEDLEKQIGLYINTLALRDSINSDSSFRDTLASVKKTCTDALNNQDYPFDRLVEELDIKRDISRSALFDVMLVLQNNDDNDEIMLDGLKAAQYKTGELVTKFDITFNFTEVGNGLGCSFEYNTEIYSEDRIRRMADHFKTLILSVSENSEAKIAELNIIPNEEKNLLINVFNSTKAGYPQDKTIVDLFEDQVVKTPDNIAIVYEDVELTYQELNNRANKVGHYLRDNHRIKADDLVGIMLGRTEHIVIAILGILKSGAAYVPIDPEYPQDRIDHMLNDSNPKIVISDKNDDTFVDINKVLESDINTRNPINIVSPEDLAYIIYTSGSTGKPKGAQIEHRNVVRLLFTEKSKFDFSENDIWSIFHSFCFDFSVWEMYGALLFGGKAIIISKDTARDTEQFSELLQASRVTVLNQTPTAFYNLAKVVNSKDLDLSVRYVIFGGEALSPSKLDFWYKRFPQCKLINMFGITETTVHVTYKEIGKYEIENNISNIGSAIPTLSTYILDKNNQLLPIGIPGELCVAGDGVCRGYLNKKELTNEKFIENPFNRGERLYKSGDSAFVNNQGELIYLGRIDNQVQLRGFRIELGEIESSLIQSKHIDSALVLPRESSEGDKYLSAYYISEKVFDVSELRDFLGKTLPDYMIPSFFFQLTDFPLTSNGKIDIKALPEPGSNLTSGAEHIAPENSTEKTLVNIWQDVLDIKKIGVIDNFFELGGHSLNAIRLISRISKELEVSVALKSIFENPTIRSLAQTIERSAKLVFKQIEPVAKQEKYDVSNAQRRLWVLDQFDNKSTAYSMPGSYILEGEFQEDAFRQAFAFMISRHESLRTVFITEKGEPKQRILDDPHFDVTVFDLRKSADLATEAKSLVDKDISKPFDLVNGPLIRLTILRLEEYKNLIIFNMHHIISDGWSLNVFSREFLGAYNSYRNNKVPAYEPLRIQYKDYSAWQNKQLNSSEISKQREYWVNKLSGDLPVLDFPTDYLRPDIKSYNGTSFKFSISKEVTEDLYCLCRDKQVSLFMLLQALLNVLIYRYTGQNDIIIGSPIAGRNHLDLENQIGFYVNTLAFRNSVDGKHNFEEVLTGVKETCTDAFDNQDYPFDSLVDELNIRKDLARTPLFDVMLVLQSIDNEEADGLDGLNVSLYETDHDVTKFDMTYNFSETSDGLVCDFEYNTDLFSEGRIRSMSQHFSTLVSSVLKNPESNISEIEIISEHENKLLMSVFNDTNRTYPDGMTIIDLFEEQVKRTPDNTAVIFENLELTYKELNKKANKIAHYLRNNNAIKPNDLIGLILERSELMIVSILGVLKSGGAYVPIDPEYPIERVEYMLEDSNPKAIITDNSNAMVKGYEQINIEEVIKSKGSVRNPSRAAKPEDSIYVIYTSGTTGKPKGAVITNKNFNNYISWAMEYYFYNSNSGNFGLFTSLSFDLTTTSVFLPLLRGNILKVYSQQSGISDILTDVFSDSIVDSVKLTPSHISLLKDLNIEDSNVKLAIVGGEELLLQQVEILNKINPDIRIVNEYGPTETTVGCIVKQIESTDDKITIGRPIANTQIYILDKDLNLLPAGVPGEIYIGGAGVGQGYLHKPQLTKGKFIDNPFVSGETVYKSGDLAKWLSNGEIEFLGRIDDQVKIRGHRIELGEIENSILNLDGIKSAAVTINIDNAGDKYLSAYYVSDNDIETSIVREFVSRSLPEYMVPSFFIKMDALPLTTNGKVDRKELPIPDCNYISCVEYIPAESDTEIKLSNIWNDVLGIERIGVLDNFFEIGGHSLKALKVVSLCNDFNWEVNLNDLYKYATIRELSTYIESYLIRSEDLISDIEIAVEALFNKFNIKFKYIEISESKQVSLVYGDCESIDEKEMSLIKAFIKGNFSDSVSPHYIISATESITAINARDLKKKLNYCREIMPAFKSAITEMDIVREFPLSPVQYIHSQRKTHSSGVIINLEPYTDKVILEKAVVKLLEKHDLLRCSLSLEGSRKIWKEHNTPPEVAIPELSFDNKILKDSDIDKIWRQIWSEEFSEDNLAFNMVLVRMNIKDSVLYMPTDHLIFDDMSGEIVEGDLLRFYKDIERSKDQTYFPIPEYSEYVKEVRTLPNTVTESELLDYFRIDDFFTLQDKVMQRINQTKTEELLMSTFRIDRGNDVPEEEVWGVSFAIVCQFLRQYFGSAELPIWFVSNGRMYRNNKYSNTVGEFLDLIPVFVELEKGFKASELSALEHVDYVNRNNINFTSILFDEDINKQWSKIKQCSESDFIEENQAGLIFNFQGRVSNLLEAELLDYKVHQKTTDAPASLSNFLCDFRYDSENFYFMISQFFESDPEKVEIIFNKAVDQVMNRVKVV